MHVQYLIGVNQGEILNLLEILQILKIMQSNAQFRRLKCKVEGGPKHLVQSPPGGQIYIVHSPMGSNSCNHTRSPKYHEAGSYNTSTWTHEYYSNSESCGVSYV